MNIGAYAVEKDYTHYVAYAAKTIFAVVGKATKGPINQAVVCTSPQDLVNKFGPLDTESYGLYAGHYFLNQASKLYYVRVADSNAAAATAVIEGKTSTDTTVADAITVAALEKGTYANGYSVTITEDADEGVYTLVVKSTKGFLLETLKNIQFEDLTVGYKTNYLEVTAKSATAANITAGTYTFAGGNNGTSALTNEEYIAAAEALKSSAVDMNLFAVPGVSDPAVVLAMLTIAENRGDCLYLLDPPKGLTRDGVIAWHNGGESYEHTAFNSSYGALYYDWVRIYDPINKVHVTVPPSVTVAATYAYSDRNSEIWFAPAGLRRGLVQGVINTATSLSKDDVDILYSDENNINSIYEDPQVGLVLWGQKTLLRTNTALNRVNVRRLLNYLKRVITAACNYLTFEPNDRITWNSFENLTKPVLRSIMNRQGIYEYRIVQGETIVTGEDIDNYRMPCMLLIKPTKAAEEIPVYFAITSTGADFNEVLEANGVV